LTTNVLQWPSTIVYPSGVARATRPTPMVPAAPAVFSMRTLCPSAGPMPCATMRATVSVGPPAANGTTIMIGRDGELCAAAAPKLIVTSTAPRTSRFMSAPCEACAAGPGEPTRRRPRRKAFSEVTTRTPHLVTRSAACTIDWRGRRIDRGRQDLLISKQSQRAESRRGRHAAFGCIGDFLIHHARKAPDRDAVLAPGRPSLTYADLAARADDAARRLRGLGVSRTDRVAVICHGGAEAAGAMISVAAGAVCVPFNPAYTASELQVCFAEMGISALVTHPDMDSAARDTARARGIPVIDDLCSWPLRAGAAKPARQRDIGGEFASETDDAFIMLTSGSTSRPKMVPLTHAAVCLSAHNVAAVMRLEPRDRLLNVLPLFHGHGLISGVVTALAAGSSVVCTSGFDAVAFFHWLTEFQPTWYTAVPAIHRAVLAAGRRGPATQRSPLRLIRSASSTLPPDLLAGLEAM